MMASSIPILEVRKRSYENEPSNRQNTSLTSCSVGGLFTFDFGRKMHQLHSITVAETDREPFLKRSGVKRLYLVDGTNHVEWFNVRRFRLRTRRPLYVIALEFSLCLGKSLQ